MFIQLAAFVSLFFGVSAPTNTFTVEAQHIQGKKATLVGKIVVLDGKSASLQISSREPFVTEVDAIRGQDGELTGSRYRPTIAVLSEGVSLKVTVREHDLHEITRSKVFLDATAEVSEIGECKTKVLDDTPSVGKHGNVDGNATVVQVPSVQTKQTRLLTPVTLGEPVRISIDDRTHESVEIVVRRQAGN